MGDKSILVEVMVIQDYYKKNNPNEVLNQEIMDWISLYGEKYRQIWESGINDKQEIKNLLYK